MINRQPRVSLNVEIKQPSSVPKGCTIIDKLYLITMIILKEKNDLSPFQIRCLAFSWYLLITYRFSWSSLCSLYLFLCCVCPSIQFKNMHATLIFVSRIHLLKFEFRWSMYFVITRYISVFLGWITAHKKYHISKVSVLRNAFSWSRHYFSIIKY